MGSKTGGDPKKEHSFMERICHALDESPRRLARNIGVKWKDFEPLLDERHMIAEIDRDEVWWKVMHYTNKRLGHILAIKSELNKALQKDRKKRLLRQERFKRLHND